MIMMFDDDYHDVWWLRWFLRGQDELIQLDLIDSVGTDGVKEKEKKECEEKKTGWNRGEKMNEKKEKDGGEGKSLD